MFGKKDKASTPKSGATRKGASLKPDATTKQAQAKVVQAKSTSAKSTSVKSDQTQSASPSKGAVKAATQSSVDNKPSSVKKLSASSNAVQQQAHYHQACVKNSLERLKASRLATSMTSALMAVSLTLPMLLLLLVSNLQQLSSGWQDHLSISVYLNVNLPEQNVLSIQRQLASISGVDSARLVTPEQGLAEFQSLAGAELLDVFDRNPLPAVIELTPILDTGTSSTSVTLSNLVNKIETITGVEDVIYDQQWIERLLNYVALAERFALLIGLLLALAAVLAISNSIRLEIENRRQEIIVIKLVGGTDSFIRLPFLYSGFWYGILGATLATVVLWIIGLWLSPFLTQLLSLYSSELHIDYLGFVDVFSLYVCSVVLAVSGAWLAVYRHLDEIEPE